MTRKKIPLPVRDQLRNYYGSKQCVVTGNKNAHYHHLDDNSEKSVFQNLVPTEPDINSIDLRIAAHNSCCGGLIVIRPRSEPRNLLLRAELHFNDWKVPQAYGCARLACFVGKQYFKMKDVEILPMACSALYFARVSTEYTLIEDVLERDILPIAERNSRDAFVRASITQEVAGFLSEHGRHRESLELYRQIPQSLLLAMTKIGSGQYAAFLRRNANSIIAEEGLTDRANGLFNDASNTAPYSLNVEASIANTLGWHWLSLNDPTRAFDSLSPSLVKYDKLIFNPDIVGAVPINISVWNAAELYHSSGIAALQLDGKYRRLGTELVEKSLELYKLSHSRPFLLRETFWDDVYRELKRNADVSAPPLIARRIPPNIERLVAKLKRWLF